MMKERKDKIYKDRKRNKNERSRYYRY